MSIKSAKSQKSLKLSDLDMKSNSSLFSSPSLFEMSIDLGDGRKDTLIINENENPEFQAIEFCQKHKLGPAVKIAICDEIDRIITSNERITIQSTATPAGRSLIHLYPVENIGEKLYIKGIKMKERIEKKSTQMRENNLKEESKNLTFKPLTNSPVKRRIKIEESLIHKGKQTSENIRRKKTDRNLEIMSRCTFSPEINKSKRGATPITRNQKDVFANLYNDAENFKQNQIKMSKKITSLECPFEPDLRLTKKKNIEVSRKPQRSMITISSSFCPEKRSISSGKSDQLLLKLKQKRYSEIFQGLLPDYTGYIGKETIYKSKLPESLLKALSPLLQEIEDLEEVLNFEEFYESMESLMRNLSSVEKNVILNTGKPKPEPEIYNFTPKINKTRLFPAYEKSPPSIVETNYSDI